MKRIRLSGLLLMCCAMPVFAGSYYLGPTVTYESFYINSIRYQAISPRLTGGYGGWMNQWVYLGGELFASPHDFKYNDNPQIDQTLKVNYTFGASVIPGVFLDNLVMAYARLGLLYAKFSQVNATRQAWQAGLGLEAKYNDNWSVRGEYAYAKFNNLSNVGSPASDEFSASILYRFYPAEDQYA